jgi:uncharacterized protein YaaQ
MRLLRTTIVLRCGGSLLALLASSTVLAWSSSISSISSSSSSSSRPQGSSATPFTKKKVAVLGAGGYAGALTAGFLQRAASLYGTGLAAPRMLGATADTAARLNRVLSKHFCLAFADEQYIKLANLTEVNAIATGLRGWDALILGTDVGVTKRVVTPGSYEKTPNCKTFELYWPAPANLLDSPEENRQRLAILQNVLQGAKLAGVQHICLVDDAQDDAVLQALQDTGVPYTCLRATSGPLVERSDYTYRVGVMDHLQVRTVLNEDSSDLTTSAVPVHREDMAALAVQTLMSLDWTQSRCLDVSSQGPVGGTTAGSGKRPDQEWCVNSYLLENSLAGSVPQSTG